MSRLKPLHHLEENIDGRTISALAIIAERQHATLAVIIIMMKGGPLLGKVLIDPDHVRIMRDPDHVMTGGTEETTDQEGRDANSEFLNFGTI